MTLGRAIPAIVVLLGMLASTGCEAPRIFRKKKAAPPAPQAEAPTITQPVAASPTPAPPAGSEPNRPEPAPAEVKPQPAETAEAKPKPRKTHAPKKPPAAAPTTPVPASQTPGTAPQAAPAEQPSGMQLSASLPHDAAMHAKMTTTQLLESTDYNLKTLARALTVDEQALVVQIRSFMTQSHNATTDGELERAYNLALKAHLLSDELMKPR